MEFLTRKSDKQSFPVKESGSRDDSDNPITFATPLVDDDDMVEFAHEQSDRVDSQYSKSELEEIKKNQEEAGKQQIEIAKEDKREVAFSLVNDVINDDELVPEMKIDLLNQVKFDYHDVLTTDDKADINHEIRVLKDEIIINKKGEKELKSKTFDYERSEKKKQHAREMKQEIRDSLKNRKLQRRILSKSGRSLTTKSSGSSQHSNTIDKDSATRLSLFLARG